MFPFAAAPGTLAGERPTALQPDAPLADDDRAGLRTLYTDTKDTTYVGSIQGQVLPANPLSLPSTPAGVTGIFGAHVVAVNVSTGNAISTLGGWSCAPPGPAQFDGSYLIEHLTVGHSYTVYAEALDGAVAPANVSTALTTLCRKLHDRSRLARVAGLRGAGGERAILNAYATHAVVLCTFFQAANHWPGHATQLNSSVGELRYVIAEKTWQENNSSSGRNHPPATKNQSWA
jgi:hypothetical protein